MNIYKAIQKLQKNFLGKAITSLFYFKFLNPTKLFTYSPTHLSGMQRQKKMNESEELAVIILRGCNKIKDFLGKINLTSE
ncbi:MAG: hypothetical protein CL935_00795 [Deltaproteobacteria bacterium]|nr:hypothetical protein [Deltaproteobacteria bacterium]